MKCKDTRRQTVMPIFYGVEPYEVRNQKQKYEEAFAIHKQGNKEKVESWRKALVDASNLAGWELKNIANGHESKAIKEIVFTISSRLLVIASANEKLIGIAARVQRLKSVLQIGLGDVRMVGIWGVGGGGKTTLASSIYDEICGNFDGCCFIANIRSKGDLEELKKEILSELGANKVGKGRCFIDKSLHNRKVLIVLDDVDQHEQLDELVGSRDWFGAGSRIIITTRDEQLLKAHDFVVHDICLLTNGEAIELFRKHAPRGSIPIKDFNQLLKEVVSYAGGLPLALKVLGSSLCGKNTNQWKSALKRLKVIPENEILKKLKISFDGLAKDRKDLFLDIACFYRGKTIYEAMERLDACGFYPVAGVEELRQKALITISENAKFDMHDLVQEMGHHIVRGEHPKNPEKHSRLWKREDLLTVCDMDASMDLDKIEAIQVENDEFQERPPLPPIVAKMRNLRYMDWKGDPANPLVNNFPSRGLCCLILSETIQDQLWVGNKFLQNLKLIELHTLDNLITTPTFDGLRSLERFRLYACRKLEEIHSSFGGLDKLVCLTVEWCQGIKRFPSITRLKKLETLSFHDCPRLVQLSEIQQKMGNGDMSSAVWELCNVNHNIRFCFFRRYLKELNLSECDLGDEDIGSAVWDLPNLQELYLLGNNFSRLNFSLIRTPRLKFLDISRCNNLVQLSGLPSSIAVLKAHYCDSLESFGDISNCKWLWEVLLLGTHRLVPLDGNILLDSILTGNAIEDHLISLSLDHEIPKEIVGRLIRGNTFTLRLPCDSYDDYSGFLIHVATKNIRPKIFIIMKYEADEDSQFELRQEFSEELVPKYDRITKTYVGYVSFNSLRRTACLNSAYNVISISLCQFPFANRIGAALVPKKCKLDNDPMQKTDCSGFWDEKHFSGPTFTVEHYSKSSIKILWQPSRGIF